ncbi:cupredoxin domain-containing protein [Hyphomicrobium sp.]|uniref:cupredoxin domain-containing protein n=1 Tax=Hyphomicrobium sp. TaxID=82 RepID=UPI002E36C13E|nr:cupredoxin domain-containing protein [Hyphomicrobium sp.]HEX2842378.1 cupredoxin domain-containing protein [Hyphomicrobium sp.]
MFRAIALPCAIFVLAATAGAVVVVAAKTVDVKIAALAFAPAEVTAHVGDTVTWENADFIDHTATSSEGGWDVVLPVGGTGRVVLTKAGTFDYICTIHPNMKGKVHVTSD